MGKKNSQKCMNYYAFFNKIKREMLASSVRPSSSAAFKNFSRSFPTDSMALSILTMIPLDEWRHGGSIITNDIRITHRISTASMPV